MRMDEQEMSRFMAIKTEHDCTYYASKYLDNDISFLSIKHEISFLYDLGLFFSEIYFTTDVHNMVFRHDDKYYNSLYFYLRAVQLFEENENAIFADKLFTNETIIRLYTNLATELKNQFRTIPAIAYYRKALDINPYFDMALAGYAHCVERHPVFTGSYEPDKVFSHIYYFYDEVTLSALDAGHTYIQNRKERYNKLWVDSYAQKLKGNEPQFDVEKEFQPLVPDDTLKNWCARETLFLNYINDLGAFEESQHDMDLSNLQEKFDLKQEPLDLLCNLINGYIYLRDRLFSCKDFQVENCVMELITTFNELYSFFDKVAFFLARYFELQCKVEDVSILSIWKKKTAAGHTLLEYKNQYLYDIYWLRKEYRESKSDKLKINHLLSPNSRDFAAIRNAIEHRGYGEISHDPHDMYSKTLALARIVRNMILSCISTVHTEKKIVDESGERNINLVYFEFEGF